MSNEVILIDGDILVYRALISAEEEVCLNDDQGEPGDIWAISCDHAKAKKYFQEAVENIVQGRPYFIALTDRENINFRKEIYPEYKAQRSSKRKPVGMQAFREWVETFSEFDVVMRPGLEADDVLGIMATKPSSGDYEMVIWSVDKDMLTIPGKIWIQGKDPVYVSEQDADRMLFKQALTGDQVDNYPGLPGVGPKTADKMLDGVHRDNLWHTVKSAYEKVGLSEEEALTQVRLARILRYSDWDTDNQKVKLWTP